MLVSQQSLETLKLFTNVCGLNQSKIQVGRAENLVCLTSLFIINTLNTEQSQCNLNVTSNAT